MLASLVKRRRRRGWDERRWVGSLGPNRPPARAGKTEGGSEDPPSRDGLALAELEAATGGLATGLLALLHAEDRGLAPTMLSS